MQPERELSTSAAFMMLRRAKGTIGELPSLCEQLLRCPKVRSLVDRALRVRPIKRADLTRLGFNGLRQFAVSCLVYLVKTNKIKSTVDMLARGQSAVATEITESLEATWRDTVKRLADEFERLLHEHGRRDSVSDEELAELSGKTVNRIRELRQAYSLSRASSAGVEQVSIGQCEIGSMGGDNTRSYLFDESHPFDYGDFRIDSN